MKQPELGNKISELRNTKGITQKELSEACNVDIRTIQRIESGEVVPRMSTLKLIATTLEYDYNLFNGNEQVNHINGSAYLNTILLISFIVGIIYFVNFLLYSRLIPAIDIEFHNNFYIVFSLIHVFSGVLFYFGFYEVIKLQHNRILQVAIIISIISIPLFVMLELIVRTMMYPFTLHLLKLLVIIIGINGFIFGAGLMIAKGRFVVLYKIAGILQFLCSPMFIIQIPVVQWIGLWLAVPFILLLLTIIFLEYRDLKYTNQYAEQ